MGTPNNFGDVGRIRVVPRIDQRRILAGEATDDFNHGSGRKVDTYLFAEGVALRLLTVSHEVQNFDQIILLCRDYSTAVAETVQLPRVYRDCQAHERHQ